MLDLEHTIREYHPIIFKICRVYASADDFDDLYQEALINIWKGLKNFKGDAKLSTWLYRVVINTALTYQRGQSRQKKKLTYIDGIASDLYPTEPATEKEEEINRLYNAIQQLKESDRSVILLYLEEKKYGEIAEIIGISESNVGARINRIKKRLYKILTQHSS